MWFPWLPVITVGEFHVHIVSAEEGHPVKGDLDVGGVGDGFPDQQQIGGTAISSSLPLHFILDQLPRKLNDLFIENTTQTSKVISIFWWIISVYLLTTIQDLLKLITCVKDYIHFHHLHFITLLINTLNNKQNINQFKIMSLFTILHYMPYHH